MNNINITEYIISEDFNIAKFNIEVLNTFDMKNQCKKYIHELFNNMNNRDNMVVGFVDYENTISLREEFPKDQVVKFIEQFFYLVILED